MVPECLLVLSKSEHSLLISNFFFLAFSRETCIELSSDWKMYGYTPGQTVGSGLGVNRT